MLERAQTDGLEERRESLAKRLAQTQAKKSKYVKLYAQGSLDEDELEVHIADAKNRIANLKLLLESVEADIAHRQQDYIERRKMPHSGWRLCATTSRRSKRTQKRRS